MQIDPWNLLHIGSFYRSENQSKHLYFQYDGKFILFQPEFKKVLSPKSSHRHKSSANDYVMFGVFIGDVYTKTNYHIYSISIALPVVIWK